MAGWQSGYAAACKAVDAGSIPTPASNKSVAYGLSGGKIFRHFLFFSPFHVFSRLASPDIKTGDTLSPTRARTYSLVIVSVECSKSFLALAILSII
jgi:hypothetical protein